LRTLAARRPRQSRVRAETSAAAGGVILVTRFAVGAVLNYAFGVGLAWLLVPARFGVVSAIQNVLLLAAGLLAAGLPWALAIRVAQNHGDNEAAKPEFRTALIANLALGVLLGTAFMATQLVGQRLVPTSSDVLDLLVTAEMPMLAVNATLAGAAQGSRRFAGLGTMQGGEILLKCVAAAVLVAALHTGPDGVALSFFLGTVGSVLIGLRTCRGLLPGRGPLASFSFLTDSGSIWFASASMTFLITADLLGLSVAGIAAGVTAAVLAGYQACSLLARASFYVSDALADAVFPFIAHSESLRDKHRWFMTAARWVPLLIIPVQVALFAAPGPVLRSFLPHHYSTPAAQVLLQVLAAGTLGALMTDMLTKSLFATGYGRQVGRRMPITVVTEVAGLIILVPRYGALGAAYSYLLASLAGVLLLAPLYRKALQVRLPSLRQLAVYTIGFAPTAAVFAVAGQAPTLIAWGLIAAGTFLFIIPARRMRLITDADISFLAGLRDQLRTRLQPATAQSAAARPAAARPAVGRPAVGRPAVGRPAAPQSEPSWPVAPQSEPSWPVAPQSEPSWPVAPQSEPSWPVAPQSEPSWPVPPWPVAPQSEPPWPATPQPEPPRPAARIRLLARLAARRADLWLAAFCTCVAGVALLYNIFTSPDVLYDEAVYTYAAQQVALGWHLTLDNQPLFVHPPLMFLLQAAWLNLTGHASSTLPSAIRAARLLAGSIGVADVLLITALAYRLASGASPRQRRVLAGVIAVVAALDPVLNRYDRQDVIEPFALCVSLLTLHAAWALRERRALVYVSATGLLGGLALLTNEITICLVAVPPLFALLERNRPLFRRSAAALAIAVAFLGLFMLWAADLGLAGSFVTIQTYTLQRLIGVLQTTGLNAPGVSLFAALGRSVERYSSSYIVLAVGFVALVWCWSRKNTVGGNFLKAWLTASYAFGAYIVAIGTLNEQFFVYLLPACIVGSVMFADALLAGWLRHARSRRTILAGHPAQVSWLPRAVAAASFAGLVALSAVSWFTNYGSASDGVVLMDHFIATELPACAAVNASGDPQKYSYLLGGRSFAFFSVGPAALAEGVHYFILSPTDVTEQTGNMSPALANWITSHGTRLADFPSAVYRTLQLWHVPASPYDPVADLVDIVGGQYVSTVGSDCGGYTVTNGSHGSFFSAYQALGGKGVLGDPLSQITAAGPGRYEQLLDGVVLAASPGAGAASPGAQPAVRALPIVATLAKRAPAAYRRAGLPPVVSHATAAQRRGWLTNPSIRRVYLDGERDSPRAYAAAVRRFGKPLGPSVARPGGGVAQAFADIVLEVPSKGASAHAESVTRTALAARVLTVPARARVPQSPPPLPNPFPLGPAQPTTAEPFLLDLGGALLVYVSVIIALVWRRPWRDGYRPPRDGYPPRRDGYPPPRDDYWPPRPGGPR
jgi:O-antigen/teichoic acid export membrane protein